MLFTFVTLWIIGIILFVTDPKSSISRWISGIAFCGGCGALAAVTGDSLIPYIANTQPQLIPIVTALSHFCSFCCYYGLPYSFLMFAVAYAPSLVTTRVKRLLRFVLLLPIPFMFLADPNYPVPYRAVIWWAAPYITAGFGLLIYAYKKEQHSLLKRNRLLILAALLPSIGFAFVTIYVMPLLDLYEMWRYNAVIIAFSAAIIVYSSFKYGFMGFRISVQKQHMNYTLKAITSGTAILNHAIKNDVGKIQLYGENVKHYASQTKQKELGEDVDVMLSASRHILHMIHRIQDQTRDIILKSERFSLRDLVEHTLSMLKPYSQNIEVKRDYGADAFILGDRVHLGEVLNNIMMNAIEAMPTGGVLTIKWYETKKSLVLEIKDTGVGIDPRHVKQVFDPFFTTKGTQKTNFGLGLTYCYNVVKHHGGSMAITSKPGQGATVYIQLLKKKSKIEFL